VVYRDRKYSDGSVQTDSIYGGPWMMLESYANLTERYSGSEYSISYGGVSRYYDRAGVWIETSTTYVPDLDGISSAVSGDMNKYYPGDYSTYLAETDRSTYNSVSPVEGWYYARIDNAIVSNLFYLGEHIRKYRIQAGYYDRFLYIDGKVIDFAEFRPSWDDGVFTTSDVSGGKVYTLECKGSYAGQEVHFMTIDSVMVRK